MSSKQFDKYEYYLRAVQSPGIDVEFLQDTYKELKKKKPYLLREDFCGTFAISCEWVKANPKNKAFSIDIDSEPIKYGEKNYLPKLSADQQTRVKRIRSSVLSSRLPSTDIIAAFNFSSFIFKDRKLMLSYFKHCHLSLKPNGILVIDTFGGAKCQQKNRESVRHKGFVYYWDQKNFDAINNYATYSIDFKITGEKRVRKNVFHYDWRMWSIPELREIMADAGFSRTHVYWEGSTRKGEGNGIFTRETNGDECQAWVAYIVGEK